MDQKSKMLCFLYEEGKYLHYRCECGYTGKIQRKTFLNGGKCRSCSNKGSNNPVFGMKRSDLSKWNKENPMIGKKNPMYGKKRPDLAINAKKWIEDVKNGNGIHPRAGKPPAHGKRYIYNGIKFRSRWEVVIAKLLDQAIPEKWRYEYLTFFFSINNKKCSYTPDFYIKHLNAVIEVKGWIYEPSQLIKIEEFKKQRPDINYIYLDSIWFKEAGLLSGNSLNRTALEILNG